jgi:hypothetical protein
MEAHFDEQQPVEANCPNYSDIEMEDDHDAFGSTERQQAQTAAELQALKDEMHGRYSSKIDSLRRTVDKTKEQIADELLLCRLSMQTRATSTRDSVLEERPLPPVCPRQQYRRIRFARWSSSSCNQRQNIIEAKRCMTKHIIKQAFPDAAAQLTGRQVELGAVSVDSDAESESQTDQRSVGRVDERRLRHVGRAEYRGCAVSTSAADLLLTTSTASGTRMISDISSQSHLTLDWQGTPRPGGLIRKL